MARHDHYGKHKGGPGKGYGEKSAAHGDYLHCTRTTSAQVPDHSMKLHGPSVNAEATRGKTQPNQATLGPRTA